MKVAKKQVHKPQLKVLGKIFTEVLKGGPSTDGDYGKYKDAVYTP